MLDLHCHLIPWVDDGADTAEVACLMAEHAYRSGVDTIVATPHCNLRGNLHNFDGPSYWKRFSMFKALLRQRGIPLEILPGAEVFVRPSNIDQLIDEQRLVTLNHSRYLLVEFNFSETGKEIGWGLEIILSHGLIPVIAHPERYECVQENISFCRQWQELGCLLQVNKGSLLGRLGDGAHRAGWELLHSELADIIATDAHDAYYRPTGFRSLLPLLERDFVPEYIGALLEGNPRCVVLDQPLPRML